MLTSLVLGPLGPHVLVDVELAAPPRLLGASQAGFKVLRVSSHDLVTRPAVSPPVFGQPAVRKSEDQPLAVGGEVCVAHSRELTPCVGRQPRG